MVTRYFNIQYFTKQHWYYVCTESTYRNARTCFIGHVNDAVIADSHVISTYKLLLLPPLTKNKIPFKMDFWAQDMTKHKQYKLNEKIDDDSNEEALASYIKI